MGAIGGLLGIAGGSGGTGFGTTPGTNPEQLQAAYTGTQNALGSQQALLNAIQQQGGLQNQSNVYNQLQGVVSGQGPNPAQAMLSQATGQNVANQAALMAGQRGATANPALIARQAAMQGANLQQQAAGQGATMQAQQALTAMGQAGEMANAQAANQIGQTNSNVTGQQNEQNTLQGANTAQNSIQGQLANTTLGGQQQAIAGATQGGGIAAKLVGGLFAGGGEVGNGSAFSPLSMFEQALSGQTQQTTPTFSAGPQWQKPEQKQPETKQPKPDFMNSTVDVPGSIGIQGASNTPMAAGGGKVPAMVSPGEKFLRPNEVQAVAQGKVSPMQVGETIPGKAKVKGDSYANDTVPKKLDEGGVVLPRSVMNSKNPEKSAAAFVRKVIAKKRTGK